MQTDQIQVLSIPVDAIAVSPDNTRLFNLRDTDETTSLKELAASIAAVGLQQPPKVRPVAAEAGPPYTLVYGERRLRAVRDILKWTHITVLVDAVLDDGGAAAATVVENMQRRDLHPIDEARGIARLRAQGLTVKQVAARLGRRPDWIKERLTLCALPTEAQDLYRRSPHMTLAQAQALVDYTHGGRENTGFPALIVALATGLADGTNPTGSLSVLVGTRPDLALTIHHAYSDGGGRWSGHFFDTRTLCTRCPFAAYRPAHYDGVGICLLPEHYAQLQTKGREAYEAARPAPPAVTPVGASIAEGTVWTPQPQKSAAQKGKETRQRHRDQKAAYAPTVAAIERMIAMIPAVDAIDLAVLCAYTLTTTHVAREAITQMMTRHGLTAFPYPEGTPTREQIERLRTLAAGDLVRYTLEALLLTQAQRARDYDPGMRTPDPVLALYVDPVQSPSVSHREEHGG